MCLGQGAYSEGLDTSTLLPQYKGVGILRGASDVSPTVRTYLADGQDAERILVAARALRERAGTLSGMALGEAPPAAATILADVLAVFGADTRAAVADPRRAARGPDAGPPGGRDRRVSPVLSAGRGRHTVDVKQFGKALKGCRLADVQAAASGDRAATGWR